MEPFYPLHVYVCEQCFLVQLQEYVTPDEIFNDYAYFSSYSDTLARARRGATAEMMRERFGLGRTATWSRSPATTATCCSTSSARGIPVLGIEPAANVAEAAIDKGIPTVVRVLRRRDRARARWRARAGPT